MKNKKKKFYIFGLQRSGTNYLQRLMATNFEVEYSNSKRKNWKHSIEAYKAYDEGSFSLVIRKNPYTWIESLCSRNKVDWSNSQNKYSSRDVKNAKECAGRNKLSVVKLAEAYRDFNTNWSIEAPEQISGKVFFVRYEDLLIPTKRDAILASIQKKFDLERTTIDSWENPPPGTVSQSKDFTSQRIEYYLKADLRVLNTYHLTEINKVFDKSFMDYLNYSYIYTNDVASKPPIETPVVIPPVAKPVSTVAPIMDTQNDVRYQLYNTHGYKIWLNVNESAMMKNRSKEQYELQKFNFMKKNLTNDHIFIDVGANKGDFTLLAASLGAKKTISVEPHPDNVNWIKRSVKENGFVIDMWEGCLCEKQGTIILYEGEKSGYHSIIKKARNISIERDGWRLDKKILMHSARDDRFMIKIDVEGAEKQVLEGAEKIMDRVDVFLIDVDSEDYEGVEALLGGDFKKLSQQGQGCIYIRT